MIIYTLYHMKEKSIAVLLLVSASVFCFSCCWAAETMIVNKAFNGREVKVRVGSAIQVQLEQLGAAGYVWEVRGLDENYFEVVSVKSPGPGPAGDVTGAPILKTWVIRAKKKGMSELKFVHFRPWEGEDKAVDTFLLKVRIL